MIRYKNEFVHVRNDRTDIKRNVLSSALYKRVAIKKYVDKSIIDIAVHRARRFYFFTELQLITAEQISWKVGWFSGRDRFNVRTEYDFANEFRLKPSRGSIDKRFFFLFFCFFFRDWLEIECCTLTRNFRPSVLHSKSIHADIILTAVRLYYAPLNNIVNFVFFIVRKKKKSYLLKE